MPRIGTKTTMTLGGMSFTCGVSMANAKPRGGARRGQGRKGIQPGEETVTMSVRMTHGQREKVERLGGAKWLRDQIDRAKEPKT